jgi:hypothetical protein
VPLGNDQAGVEPGACYGKQAQHPATVTIAVKTSFQLPVPGPSVMETTAGACSNKCIQSLRCQAPSGAGLEACWLADALQLWQQAWRGKLALEGGVAAVNAVL